MGGASRGANRAVWAWTMGDAGAIRCGTGRQAARGAAVRATAAERTGLAQYLQRAGGGVARLIADLYCVVARRKREAGGAGAAVNG